MNQKHYLLAEVARLLNVRPHQIAYAITNRLVPEPALRIGGRRVFQAEDIERLRNHFLGATTPATPPPPR
jgi:DNA-binding transcriptional MerR regulator